MPTISQPEARRLAINFLEETVGFNLSDFDLVSSNINRLRNRTDYTFRWETEYQDPSGILALQATIKGSSPGSFELTFDPSEELAGNNFNMSEALINTLSIVFLFFLTQFAIYFFIKKYHQGEVWLKIGKQIFIIFYIILIIQLVNLWPALGNHVFLGNISLFLTKLILVLLYSLVLYLILSLLVFASWSVGESYARELWPEKLKGVDAFFKGKLFTRHSGISIFQGFVLALGFIFLVAIIEVLINSGGHSYFISFVDSLAIYSGITPAVGIISAALEMSFLSSIVLGFFVINISYQKWKKKWLSIVLTGVVTTASVIVAVAPPPVYILPVDLALIFLFGCVYAYVYFKFDLLTLASALFYITLISQALVLFSSSNPFYEYNLIPLILLILSAPIVYAVSRIRNEEFALEHYGTPSHIARISERERLKKEMEIAAKVQLSLLPKENPVVEGYDIAGLSIPAIEAGGDYYDFVKLDHNKLGIAIGDVSGKGVGAAIYMTLTKGILQAHAEENVSPGVVLGKVNKLLYKSIEKNSFVSMYYSILDWENHKISFARAGHNPAIYCCDEDGKTTFLTSEGMALGLEEGSIFSRTLVEGEKEIKPGDVIIYYTDGFTEAMNESLEQYGEKRLVNLIESNKNKSASELVDTILRNVRKFMDNYPQHDDMTIVMIKRR